jgi:hypothetical protein
VCEGPERGPPSPPHRPSRPVFSSHSAVVPSKSISKTSPLNNVGSLDGGNTRVEETDGQWSAEFLYCGYQHVAGKNASMVLPVSLTRNVVFGWPMIVTNDTVAITSRLPLSRYGNRTNQSPPATLPTPVVIKLLHSTRSPFRSLYFLRAGLNN